MSEFNRVIQGDCLEVLRTLPDESVNCCVTSPPYYGLRDYGTGKWIGGDPNCPHRRITKYSEKTITGHAQKELAGNVGDAIYKKICPLCGAVREDKQIGLEETPEEYVEKLTRVFHEVKRVLKDDGTLWLNIGDSYNITSPNYKQKDLIGIPWLLAFSLRADGWFLRQDIIWHKPNPMPESVTDRCTKSHEYIFLMAKKPRYYFDYEAIQEVSKWTSKTNSDAMFSKYQNADHESQMRQGMNRERGNNLVLLRKNLPTQSEFVSFIREATTPEQLANETDIKRTTIDHWFRTDESGFSFPSVDDWLKVRDYVDDWSETFQRINEGLTNIDVETDEIGKNNQGKRNKRDVWTVSTKPVKEAHFATFPEKLIEPCILAGSPPGGVVLDPFFGSGTTGRVAIRLNRQYLGIELNPEYVKISDKRTDNIQLQMLFNE